jgi:hypothetical protein
MYYSQHTCSECYEEGHNRRTCPLLYPEKAASRERSLIRRAERTHNRYKANAYEDVLELYKTEKAMHLSKVEELATNNEDLDMIKIQLESLQEKCRDLEQQLQDKNDILLNVSDAVVISIQDLSQLGTELTARHILDQPANILEQTSEKIRKIVKENLFLISANTSK